MYGMGNVNILAGVAIHVASQQLYDPVHYERNSAINGLVSSSSVFYLSIDETADRLQTSIYTLSHVYLSASTALSDCLLFVCIVLTFSIQSTTRGPHPSAQLSCPPTCTCWGKTPPAFVTYDSRSTSTGETHPTLTSLPCHQPLQSWKIIVFGIYLICFPRSGLGFGWG